ncbi:MAG: efflux RND transporter permease subunit, partial [Puniceicoccales bacterium]|nr:efflux RND transporter permease subunit [Puniceicoccales bacterium]
MESLSEVFIRRPVATVLAAVTLVVFGTYCYFKLPVGALPRVDYPMITISARYPGMGPETMANSIASPLEKELMTVQGVKDIYSESRLGSTSIKILFELDKSIDVAAMDVQSAITRAQGKLPSDIPSPPVYFKNNPNNDPFFFMAAVTNTLTMGDLYDYANTQIAQQISGIEGVSQVQVFGAAKAVRLHLNIRKIQAMGMAMDEIVEAVKKHSFLLTTGSIKGQFQTLTLTTTGQIIRAKDFGNIVVASRRGSPIYLKDIARCEEGLESEDLSMKFWGRELPPFGGGIMMAVSQSPGTNTVEVAGKIRTLLPYLQRSMPKSVHLIPVYDKSRTILDSIGEVKETIIIAFVLVAAVIFLFFGRLRESFIPVVT